VRGHHALQRVGVREDLRTERSFDWQSLPMFDIDSCQFCSVCGLFRLVCLLIIQAAALWMQCHRYFIQELTKSTPGESAMKLTTMFAIIHDAGRDHALAS
jgi:hypothetical protein